MKINLSSIAYWTISPGIQRILKRSISRKNAVHIIPSINKNQIFHNIHSKERCFILASGPSIQTQDLSVLKNEYCIAVSHFHLHHDITKIQPQYHILAPYHPPFGFLELKKVFDDFNKAYASIDIQYFFGHSNYQYSIYNFLRSHPQYHNTQMYFMDYTDPPSLNDDNYLLPETWDICKKPFAPRTVIYSAIQLAYYMGFSEIFLLGCDHDYINDVHRTKNHHFYKEEEGVSDHDHLSSFTTERWFEEYYYRWKQYRLMNTFLRANDCLIYNATNGGMLDVFPRVKFEDVI